MCCDSTFVTVVLVVVVDVLVYVVVAPAAVFDVVIGPLPFEDWFLGLRMSVRNAVIMSFVSGPYL